jgi:hypothetical protein
MDDLKFQWYKSNKTTNQLEAITSKISFNKTYFYK